MYKEAKKVIYHDMNGNDISNKPAFMLDILQVIGSCHSPNGEVIVEVIY
jgi:hypothetical protein